MISKLVFTMVAWSLCALFAGFCFAAFITPIALMMRAFGVI